MLFAVRYLWWLARHGYWNNPYEIEARAAEHAQKEPPMPEHHYSIFASAGIIGALRAI